MKSERDEIVELVDHAQKSGARQAQACDVVGISNKTLQRWTQPNNHQDGRIEATHEPHNKLSEIERQRIIALSNDKKFAHLAPSQIVPKLADQGRYIASESTFYRVLKECNQLNHRNKAKPSRKIAKPRALTALRPNQVYTWDITYLRSPVKGLFFYLYLVLDIYSRKIVGWQVHSEELSELAADLMVDIYLREGVKPDQVTLHSDNGSPMKGATLLATLQDLGVVPSFSRPSVSNDNPFSESIFRTLKYRPEYPEKAFANLLAARQWVTTFVQWYNHEHCHSGIKFVTPIQRHRCEDDEILTKREQVYQQAKLKNPERWTGATRNWQPIKEVQLNPEKGKSEIKQNKAA